MKQLSSCEMGSLTYEPDFARQLAAFKVYRLHITLIALQNAVLPEFQGSMLRGAFLSAFRALNCTARISCLACNSRTLCLYHHLFEARLPKHELRSMQDIPPPIVLQPPLKSTASCSKGDRLIFSMTLFGSTVKYLPEIIRALKEMGERGLGVRRAKFKLEAVESLGQIVFHSSEGRLHRCFPLNSSDLVGEDSVLSDTVQLESLTPLRLKSQGTLQSKLSFEILVRALIRRSSALMTLYGPNPLDFDWGYICQDIQNISSRALTQEWHELIRYSNRQHAKLKMGGVMGVWQFRGNLRHYAPLLHFGSQVGVGKSCMFGLGQYRINWLRG